MPYVQVERNSPLYEAEYSYENGMVAVFGIRGGQSSVDLNGMTETAAAYTALRNLVKENKVNPLSE